jgi:hypothetical protein
LVSSFGIDFGKHIQAVFVDRQFDDVPGRQVLDGGELRVELHILALQNECAHADEVLGNAIRHESFREVKLHVRAILPHCHQCEIPHGTFHSAFTA